MKIKMELTRADGYGDCWFCNAIFVDPRRFAVKMTDGDLLTVCICDDCCEDELGFAPDEDR